jgi:hypothetical protein
MITTITLTLKFDERKDGALRKLLSWMIVLLISAFLGLSRHVISDLIKGGNPAISMVLSISLFSLIVLLYFAGRVWGYGIQISYFLANGWRVFFVSLCALMLFMLPESIIENSIWFDWVFDLAVALLFSMFFALLTEGFIRKQIPSSPGEMDSDFQ